MNAYIESLTTGHVRMLADAGHTTDCWCVLGGVCGTFLVKRSEYREYESPT